MRQATDPGKRNGTAPEDAVPLEEEFAEGQTGRMPFPRK